MRSTPCSGGGLGSEIHSSFVTGIISAVRWRFPPSLVVLGLYIYQVMSEPAKEVVVIGAGNLGFALDCGLISVNALIMQVLSGCLPR